MSEPVLYPGTPHALDRDAYRAGVNPPQLLLQLEDIDPFWRTLGGSTTDPFGCGGETFRQRAKADALGIGSIATGHTR
ncbi:hypothetical protein K9B35_14420 [Sphingomonas sp. R647]|uniref:hypothetical protein n=1 Tax=Sphingomonas sp. R647 TaxID=2875233 RepID=UPI001CD7111B|nr:hypothetical protein [Sphingomonas sp. R647]MCA1199169.1 hypothetical protein [Sphingomonas sp. R647]